MNFKLVSSTILILSISFSDCSDKVANDKSKEESSTAVAHLTLSEAQAAQIFSLPIHCLEVDYPNKLGQVLGSDQGLKSPKSLRPMIHSGFDCHSSLHAYWTPV